MWTDRQTDMLITILQSPTGGGVINSLLVTSNTSMTLGMNQATRYASQHIWYLSQTRINSDGCGRKGIRRKNGGDDGAGGTSSTSSLDWVASSWFVGPSASVFFVLHHKTQNIQHGMYHRMGAATYTSA